MSVVLWTGGKHVKELSAFENNNISVFAVFSPRQMRVMYLNTLKEWSCFKNILIPFVGVNKRNICLCFVLTVTFWNWRHHKEFTGLKKNEKRERFQIRLQRNEILDDLRKVRRGYTGHYDESKSPIENIQCALRYQCQTPLRSSRLHVPNLCPIRKAKSMESMPVQRPVTVSPSGESGVAPRTDTEESAAKSSPKPRRQKLASLS